MTLNDPPMTHHRSQVLAVEEIRYDHIRVRRVEEKKAEERRERAAKAHETASATLSKLPEDIRKAYEKQLEMLARLMTK